MEHQADMSGDHFLNGDDACAEGALAVGCRFFAGYPITPATEIAERMAERLPELGGTFIQMEDEIASMGAIIGASWGGVKSMTSTSGPGFCLMLENLGLALMTETPCVVANVQRGGPSTGLPTLVAQQDMMQARWGTHGDYEMIVLSPESPQEMFDLTVEAFNLSERFRQPVLLMADEAVAHLTERVSIPPPEAIVRYERRRPEPGQSSVLPFAPGPDGVPLMAPMGEGYAQHITGLTHDQRGYPQLNEETQRQLITRLVNKIRDHRQELTRVVTDGLDDAQVAVLTYGITGRVARRAVSLARERGTRVGLARLQIVWPFPDHVVAALAEQVDTILVPEINMGQIVREVERAAHGRCRVVSLPHAGGALHDPEAMALAIDQAAREPRQAPTAPATPA